MPSHNKLLSTHFKGEINYCQDVGKKTYWKPVSNRSTPRFVINQTHNDEPNTPKQHETAEYLAAVSANRSFGVDACRSVRPATTSSSCAVRAPITARRQVIVSLSAVTAAVAAAVSKAAASGRSASSHRDTTVSAAAYSGCTTGKNPYKQMAGDKPEGEAGDGQQGWEDCSLEKKACVWMGGLSF